MLDRGVCPGPKGAQRASRQLGALQGGGSAEASVALRGVRVAQRAGGAQRWSAAVHACTTGVGISWSL